MKLGFQVGIRLLVGATYNVASRATKEDRAKLLFCAAGHGTWPTIM